MKIKLHNSLCKIDNEHIRFIFDDKMFIPLRSGFLILRYRITDFSPFLYFYPRTKEFEKSNGFGLNKRLSDPNWWKKSSTEWKEMKNENQIA